MGQPNSWRILIYCPSSACSLPYFTYRISGLGATLGRVRISGLGATLGRVRRSFVSASYLRNRLTSDLDFLHAYGP